MRSPQIELGPAGNSIESVRDSTVRRLSAIHRSLYRVTGGRVGQRLVDNDMLLLTTSGRGTGRPHTVPLLYLRHGQQLVVIASYGGRPHHPDWYLNLLAEPRAEVQVGGRQYRVLARTAKAPERAEWWPRVVDAYPGYTEYQLRTAREIPVVFLEAIAV
jgi:deazaflavin-dependent oxidoreductase (nitroreductase family)